MVVRGLMTGVVAVYAKKERKEEAFCCYKGSTYEMQKDPMIPSYSIPVGPAFFVCPCTSPIHAILLLFDCG